MLDIMLKTKIKHLLIIELLIKNPIELKGFFSLVESVSLLGYFHCVVVDIYNLLRVFPLLEVLSELGGDWRLALENCHASFFETALFVALEGSDADENLEVLVLFLLFGIHLTWNLKFNNLTNI